MDVQKSFFANGVFKYWNCAYALSTCSSKVLTFDGSKPAKSKAFLSSSVKADPLLKIGELSNWNPCKSHSIGPSMESLVVFGFKEAMAAFAPTGVLIVWV